MYAYGSALPACITCEHVVLLFFDGSKNNLVSGLYMQGVWSKTGVALEQKKKIVPPTLHTRVATTISVLYYGNGTVWEWLTARRSGGGHTEPPPFSPSPHARHGLCGMSFVHVRSLFASVDTKPLDASLRAQDWLSV